MGITLKRPTLMISNGSKHRPNCQKFSMRTIFPILSNYRQRSDKFDKKVLLGITDTLYIAGGCVN